MSHYLLPSTPIYGHVAPMMPLVNGALAHLTVTDNERSIVQELG